jgi:hypothetical protein
MNLCETAFFAADAGGAALGIGCWPPAFGARRSRPLPGSYARVELSGNAVIVPEGRLKV